MKSYTPKEIIAILHGNGFVLDRINGSHHIFINQTNGRRAVVPVHSKDLKKGTLHSILKQAGIDLKRLIMNIAKERRAIEAALDDYRRQLDGFTEEMFGTTPPIGGWSYSEVYSHIMKSSLGSSIALERCTHNNCPPTKKGMNFWGHYLILTGNFPPFKTNVPALVAAKVSPKKIDIEEARNQIIKVRKRIESTAQLIADAPPRAKWEHPRLGMLNAAQWFKFIRVHLEHHLGQLDRIRKSFGE